MFKSAGVNFERQKLAFTTEDYYEHSFSTTLGIRTYHDRITAYKDAKYIIEGEFEVANKDLGWRVLPAGKPIKMKVFNWIKGEGPDEINIEKTFSWRVCQSRFREMFEIDKKGKKWVLQGNFCP